MPILYRQSDSVFFYHIPKTGGRAIEEHLRSQKVRIALHSPKLHGTDKLGFPCSPQHFHAEIVTNLFRDKTFFKLRFAVVRHPVDRMLSEYRMFDANLRVSIHKWVDRSFIRYSTDSYYRDNHFRPQTEFIDQLTAVYR
jgi:hypothetical protein